MKFAYAQAPQAPVVRHRSPTRCFGQSSMESPLCCFMTRAGPSRGRISQLPRVLSKAPCKAPKRTRPAVRILYILCVALTSGPLARRPKRVCAICYGAFSVAIAPADPVSKKQLGPCSTKCPNQNATLFVAIGNERNKKPVQLLASALSCLNPESTS